MADNPIVKIEAVVRNSRLHLVKEALKEKGIQSFSSYEIKIGGIVPGHASWRSPNRKASDFIPKSKIEVICTTIDQEKIISTILEAAHTGETGDGIVFVYQIDKLIKIKDHSTAENAL